MVDAALISGRSGAILADAVYLGRTCPVAGVKHTCETVFSAGEERPAWWSNFYDAIAAVRPRHERELLLPQIIAKTSVTCTICLRTAVYDMWTLGKALIADYYNLLDEVNGRH